MNVIPKNLSLSIQRSVKVEEYKYNKIELGMVVDVEGQPPKVVIEKLYSYLDTQVNRLLKVEVAKAYRDTMTIAEMITEGQTDNLFKEE